MQTTNALPAYSVRPTSPTPLKIPQPVPIQMQPPIASSTNQPIMPAQPVPIQMQPPISSMIQPKLPAKLPLAVDDDEIPPPPPTQPYPTESPISQLAPGVTDVTKFVRPSGGTKYKGKDTLHRLQVARKSLAEEKKRIAENAQMALTENATVL